MDNYPAINTSLAQTRYNLTHKPGRNIQQIVVHYTGTSAPAINNAKYFGGGNRNASADWFIDKDGTIVQFNADPRNYYSWHCGDGGGRYGISNAYSVGIEVVSAGEDFTKAQINALNALVTALMEDYGVPANRVVRHYDASRKLCPAPYAGPANEQKWLALWKTITTKEDIVTPQDKKDIAREVWDYLIANEAAWSHLYWAHQDGAWIRAQQGDKKAIANAVADAIVNKVLKKKDNDKLNMTVGDFLGWTNADTAYIRTICNTIIQKLDAIEKK